MLQKRAKSSTRTVSTLLSESENRKVHGSLEAHTSELSSVGLVVVT